LVAALAVLLAEVVSGAEASVVALAVEWEEAEAPLEVGNYFL
jgi:hypothetical protein